MKTIAIGVLLMSVLALQGCVGLGCGVADPDQSELSLYVVDDASGAPIARPIVKDAGGLLAPSCRGEQSGGACEYYLIVLDRGHHQLDVSAPGYARQTVEVDLSTSP